MRSRPLAFIIIVSGELPEEPEIRAGKGDGGGCRPVLGKFNFSL